MPQNADSVVVQLIADNSQFDANVRSSAAAYQQGMDSIETAADGAEKAHGRLTLSMNNSRIGMLEFQHVARGTADQIAAGAPLTQILTEHMGELSEAVSLSGGALGAFGEVLSGPVGVGLTLAASLIATLILRHKEEGETLDSLVEKLKKHHDQTVLQNEADLEWGHTLDALIDKLDRLNAESGKKLEQPNLVNQQSFNQAQAYVQSLSRLIDKTEADPNATEQQIQQLYDALSKAVLNLRNQTSLLGKQVGDVFSDATKRVDDLAQTWENKIRYITGVHPELVGSTGQIDAAFAPLKKAFEDAAKANVPFDSFTKQVDNLNERLAESPGFIKDYIADLKRLATQLEDTANSAKSAPDAIKKFEQAVIGAEGTGQNRLGSSAAGYGQFMPSTFESYFKRLYPQQASTMSDQEIDALRNNREVATSVIDAATQDYVKVLQNAGQQITEASLYTIHLLGQGSGLKLLNAPGGEQTSNFLSAGVLRGNPFLNGTADQARAAIAGRIGASSSTVSAGAVALAKQQMDYEQAIQDIIDKSNATQEKTVIVTKEQVENVADLLNRHQSLKQVIEDTLPSLKSWQIEYEQIIATQKELLQEGDQLVDDIFNPNNWSSWGNAGKTVLHDLEMEFLKLAAIDPIKNLLAGPNASELPTLGSLFSLFGGGGGGLGQSASWWSDTADMFGFDSGGYTGNGDRKAAAGIVHGKEYVFDADSVARLGVPFLDSLRRAPGYSGGGFVSPSNSSAASPFARSSGGTGDIYINVDAKDAVLAQTVQGWIAEGMTRAAAGGAVLARRNLARESANRLE